LHHFSFVIIRQLSTTIFPPDSAAMDSKLQMHPILSYVISLIPSSPPSLNPSSLPPSLTLSSHLCTHRPMNAVLHGEFELIERMPGLRHLSRFCAIVNVSIKHLTLKVLSPCPEDALVDSSCAIVAATKGSSFKIPKCSRLRTRWP
jgi:hypothetical protein